MASLNITSTIVSSVGLCYSIKIYKLIKPRSAKWAKTDVRQIILTRSNYQVFFLLILSPVKQPTFITWTGSKIFSRQLFLFVLHWYRSLGQNTEVHNLICLHKSSINISLKKVISFDINITNRREFQTKHASRKFPQISRSVFDILDLTWRQGRIF